MLDKIPEALSLKPTRILAVAIATGLALFLPASATDTLGLTQAITTARPWIGAGFIMAIAILLAEGMAVPAKYLYQRARDWLLVRNLAGSFKDLSDAEKEVLASYLLKNTKTQGFNATSGVIGALQKQQILVRVTSLGHFTSFQYGVQPWAWKYLNKHPEAVGLSEETIREFRSRV